MNCQINPDLENLDKLNSIYDWIPNSEQIRPSYELKANKEILPIEGIKEKFVNATIKYAKGYSSEKSDKNIILKKEDLKISKNADIVLFFGGLNKNNSQDSENSDRLQYKLPYGQDELIKELSKVNENLAIILISGNAVETSWKSNVKSIIQSWYLGSESGNALAAILSGEINPSGKLPFSFPKKLKDTPITVPGSRFTK